MNETETYNANDDAYEELVAYLDGELDADAGKRVEKRLAEDAEYRRELKQLELTWDMLDELPKAEVSERFTQTTVEMVVLSAERELEATKGHEHRKSHMIWAFAGGGILAASLISYLLFMTFLSRPNQELLQDLPVIENVELYSVGDSVEFLQQLDEQGLFEEKGLFDKEVDDAN